MNLKKKKDNLCNWCSLKTNIWFDTINIYPKYKHLSWLQEGIADFVCFSKKILCTAVTGGCVKGHNGTGFVHPAPGVSASQLLGSNSFSGFRKGGKQRNGGDGSFLPLSEPLGVCTQLSLSPIYVWWFRQWGSLDQRPSYWYSFPHLTCLIDQ